jgi:hypothetical protein
MALWERQISLVGFHRASLPMPTGKLTREVLGHAGVILFRRSVPSVAYDKQARLLVAFWHEAEDWDWADRIECHRSLQPATPRWLIHIRFLDAGKGLFNLFVAAGGDTSSRGPR